MDEVLVRRLKLFKQIMAEQQPDIFMVELFPFGRKKFRFELLPIPRKRCAVASTASAGPYARSVTFWWKRMT